jgi:hypothetical protein
LLMSTQFYVDDDECFDLKKKKKKKPNVLLMLTNITHDRRGNWLC